VRSVNLLSGSVPTPDSHYSRRSASPERGTPAALVEIIDQDGEILIDVRF